MEEKQRDPRGILGAIFSKTCRATEKKQGWVSPFHRAEVRRWEKCLEGKASSDIGQEISTTKRSKEVKASSGLKGTDHCWSQGSHGLANHCGVEPSCQELEGVMNCVLKE